MAFLATNGGRDADRGHDDDASPAGSRAMGNEPLCKRWVAQVRRLRDPAFGRKTNLVAQCVEPGLIGAEDSLCSASFVQRLCHDPA